MRNENQPKEPEDIELTKEEIYEVIKDVKINPDAISNACDWAIYQEQLRRFRLIPGNEDYDPDFGFTCSH